MARVQTEVERLLSEVRGAEEAVRKILGDVPTTRVATTAYTFVLADKDTVVQSTSGSATVFTVAPDPVNAIPIGTVIGFEQYGAGVLTIAAGSGVTIRNPHDGLGVSAQYGGGALRKIATNEWMITGMLE